MMNRRDFLAASAIGTAMSVLPTPSRAGIPDYRSAGANLTNADLAAEGFAFPAEWRPHERTLMQFPPPQNWYEHQLMPARQEWATVANTVAEFEPVTMAVCSQDRNIARKLLSSQIELIEMPLNDAWSRDSGPIIVVNQSGERQIAGFTFNGWGGKFPPFGDDALAKARFASYLDMPIRPSKLVLEGGAVAVDGEGTLLTTEECLMHKNRNPGWSKGEIEAELKSNLGVQKVIWLPRGLTPDPITDGHIDGIAAFVEPGVVLLHTTADRSDPNFGITQRAKQILNEQTDAKGRHLEVIEIPLTSYDVVHMNFYICNGAVVVPVAGKRSEDDLPLSILREAYPRHKVIGVTGRILASGGGGVHCITQQVPMV